MSLVGLLATRHVYSTACGDLLRGCSQMTSSPEGEGGVSEKMTNDDGGRGGTGHWIQDNFVFGQNSKSLLVFINGPVRSFGTFYATF